MTYTVEKDNESGLYIASTEDYPGTFYGYGESKDEAIESLKAEVEFAVSGGYKDEKSVNYT